MAEVQEPPANQSEMSIHQLLSLAENIPNMDTETLSDYRSRLYITLSTYHENMSFVVHEATAERLAELSADDPQLTELFRKKLSPMPLKPTPKESKD